jgi:hypothetical protein
MDASTVDSSNDPLSLKIPGGLNKIIELNFNQPEPGTLVLEGLVSGHRLRLILKKEERRFNLNAGGFRWINNDFMTHPEADLGE